MLAWRVAHLTAMTPTLALHWTLVSSPVFILRITGPAPVRANLRPLHMPCDFKPSR